MKKRQAEADDNVQLEGVWKEMFDGWPGEIVARTKIGQFTGGMLSSKYLANLDSMGLGPEKISFGRRVGYIKKPLILWLMGRSIK